jgi:hypothetical protein
MPNQYNPTRKCNVKTCLLLYHRLTSIFNVATTAPLDELAPHILRYWKARLNDKEIVRALQKHFDTDRYGIGCVH